MAEVTKLMIAICMTKVGQSLKNITFGLKYSFIDAKYILYLVPEISIDNAKFFHDIIYVMIL